jgi:hypothetical protein
VLVTRMMMTGRIILVENRLCVFPELWIYSWCRLLLQEEWRHYCWHDDEVVREYDFVEDDVAVDDAMVVA